jgi:hypothetical protein
MSKIVVVNPMTTRTKNVVRDVVYGCWCRASASAGPRSRRSSCLQIASCLKAAGFEVVFLDAQAEQRAVTDYATCLPGSIW